MEMERSDNVMVVTHQAVIRCIYAYFMNVPQDRSPWMEIPLHTVIKLTPRAYGTQEERYVLNTVFSKIIAFKHDIFVVVLHRWTGLNVFQKKEERETCY